MERPQDLLPGIWFEVPIDDVRDHEAGSARFVGHRGGWGWRDATENLLQAPVIHRLTSGICTGGGVGVGGYSAPFTTIHFSTQKGELGEGSANKTKTNKTGKAEEKELGKLNTARVTLS